MPIKNKNKSYLFIIFIFLVSFLFLYPYIRSLFVSPYYMSGDTSEYFGFTNRLLDGSSIRDLRNYNQGVTGMIPLYSKFPGLFILLTNLSLVVGLPVVFSFQILFFVFLFCLLIILFKTPITLLEYSNKKIEDYLFIILIVLLFCVFRYENRIFLSTQYINYFFVFTSIYLFLNRKIKDNTKLIFISLLSYSQIIFHHQSFLFTLPIYLFIFGYLFFRNRDLRRKILLLSFLLGVILFIHFYIFLLPDLNNFLTIGNIIISENTKPPTLLNLDQIKFIQERVVFILLSLLCILKYREKFEKERSIIPFLFFYSLFGILQPYFFPLRFQDFLHFSFILIMPLFLYFYSTKKIKIILSTLFLIFLLISVLPNYSKDTGMNNEYINFALELKHQNLFNSGCVLSDPITQFNFGHIANYNSCYNYMRPTRYARDYYFTKEKYLRVFEKTNIDDIYKDLKSMDVSYLIFDSVFTPNWTPMIKYLKSKESNKIDVWESLDEHQNIILMKKKIYQKEYGDYKNYTLYVYKIK